MYKDKVDRIFGPAIYVTDKERNKYYIARPTLSQAKRLDNGHLISIGLIVGEDIGRRTIRRWVSNGTAREIDRESWNHSGCQSSCKRRGDSTCSW